MSNLNPTSSKAKVGDHYIRSNSDWQKRVIVRIEGKHCYYISYVRDFIRKKRDDGLLESTGERTDWYNPGWSTGYATLDHMRSWSQK